MDTSPRRVAADDLNAAMDLDHVVRIHSDGTLSDEPGVYAPDVYLDVVLDEHGDLQTAFAGWDVLADSVADQGWEPVGQSGQQGGGPWMHASEFIGGGLADLVLSTPGVYVATEVRCLADSDDPDVQDQAADDSAGWVLLRRIETAAVAL